MARGGTGDPRLNPADKTRSNDIIKWFCAFTTDAEATQLLPAAPAAPAAEHSEQRRLVAKLEKLEKARLAKSFTDLGVQPPRSLQQGSKALKASSIEQHLKTLATTKGYVKIKPDKDSFSAFREAFEAPTAIATAVAAPSSKKRARRGSSSGGGGGGSSSSTSGGGDGGGGVGWWAVTRALLGGREEGHEETTTEATTQSPMHE